ncbi:putative WD domain [Paratrimastix pyriformis]|uniref:WD domain n=1 Tax=Paratrimastix pyriformis TaxID=342808 RepID=A0ABQ8UXS4_9EUKA|nr:putative WD domain [Paratrimastix pyriformis]
MAMSSWLEGPTRDRQLPPHESNLPILCMSTRGTDIVTGGADHALQEYNAIDGTRRRILFSQRYGHRDWVTCVSYAHDGRILSGGSDAQLCLWDRTGVRCDSLTEHSSSISAVQCDTDGPFAISGSYDKTLKVWSLNGKRCLHTLVGHNAPVFDLSRDGVVILWDVNRGVAVATLRGHSAPVSTMTLLSDRLGMLATGAQDGEVCLWDMRDPSRPAFKRFLHSRAAVGAICECQDPSSIITGGSDNTLRVLDPAAGYEVRATLAGHQSAVVSASAVASQPSLVVSGGVNGWVLVHSIDGVQGDVPQQALYALGANKAAVRCLEVLSDGAHLAVAGEDGSAAVYDFC